MSEQTQENEELKKDIKQEEKVPEEKQEKCKEELKKRQEELDDLTDRYKRVMAEFENFKKRNQKEREGLYKSIIGDVVESILPIMDNLENALKVETKDENYKQGVELVLKQFQEVLVKFGVEEIQALGNTFDPELHEAVSSIQDTTKGEQEIVEEYRKGYKIGTKVIRHSMVVVAN